MAESGWLQWTIILGLTAFLLSLVVVAQILSAYSAGYMAAPREVVTFIDAVDFSIQENESYDRDVARVPRLEDKIRLGRLFREIQKGGDDLREDLNALLLAEGATTLRTSARLLWASKRSALEDRVRRLDLLRMRFLVVYMGIITSAGVDKQPQQIRPMSPISPISPTSPPPPVPPPMPRDLEKMSAFSTPARPGRPNGFPRRGPPTRRLTTQAIGHNEGVGRPQRRGWAGVVEELQMSPRMHQRRTSIEQSMMGATTPP